MKIFTAFRLVSISAKVNRYSKQQFKCFSSTGRLSFKQGLAAEQAKTLIKSEISFKIVDEQKDFIRGLQPTGSNVQLADLECRLEGQQNLILNLTWLRDSCHCDECTHKFSRQRLFTPKDFNRDLFNVDNVQLVSKHVTGNPKDARKENGKTYLNVKWSDGHESSYALDWLNNLHSLYVEPRLKPGARQREQYVLPADDFYAPKAGLEVRQKYWSVADILKNLKPVDYHDLLDGFVFHEDDPTFINANLVSEMTKKRFNSILDLTEQLSQYGLAKIINVPRERDHVLKVARSLAYERPTGYGTIFDVVIEPSEEINLAYSSQEFDLHSDLTYREKSPGVQMLHCISNSVDGGLSYFADAFQAADIMKREDPSLFDVLVNFPVVFVVRDPYRDMKFRRQKPILTLNHVGELDEVYHSQFMLPPIGHRDDLKLFYLAQDKFIRLLHDSANKYITKMDPGDLFIFNNRRVLHGRSSYDPKTSNRFLQGCYMDWDEISCMREKFESNNG